MKKLISLVLSVLMLLSCASFPVTSYAYYSFSDNELDTLDVYGYRDYQEAFDCLEEINKYRGEVGAAPLVMDKTELEIAMVRAAECAVYGYHRRPNNDDKNGQTKGYTIYDGVRYEYSCFFRKLNESENPGIFSGENLTSGNSQYYTGKAAAGQWYLSDGHRKNLQNYSYKSTGIGCLKYADCTIWIEVFATYNADEEAIREDYPTEPVLKTYSIQAVNEKYVSYEPNFSNSVVYSLCVDILDTEYEDVFQYTGQSNWTQNEQDKIVLRLKEGYRNSLTTIIDPSKVTYSSLNPDKVSVAKDGTFTVLVDENTTAKLCATYQGKSYYKEINIVKRFDPNENDPNYDFGSDECEHEWDNGVIDEPADCISDGWLKITCKICGDFYYEDIPTKGHSYKTTTIKADVKNSKNGYTKTVCTICGYEKSYKTIYYPKSISLSSTSYSYNGKAKKPSVTVKTGKGKTLKNGTDYTVAYPNGRKKVGKYTVTIKFKGNYSGTVKKIFTIKPKGTSLKSLTKKKKSFTVKWKKQTTQTTGYQIQYATNSKFTKNKKTVTVSKNKTTSKKISKLQAKKKYYVRIRTYKTVKINGKSTKIYSSWSKSKCVTTK